MNEYKIILDDTNKVKIEVSNDIKKVYITLKEFETLTTEELKKLI